MKHILFYSNQPVFRHNGKTYTQLANFIDFIGELSSLSEQYELLVPAKMAAPPASNFTQLNLPSKTIYLDNYYYSHGQALFASQKSALSINTLARQYQKRGDEIIMAGPGPNSCLNTASFLAPTGTRFIFFIRGNTLKTVSSIYKGTPWHAPATLMVRMFDYRIRSLLRSGKALVFTIGEKLVDLYPGPTRRVIPIHPLINKDLLRENTSEPLTGDMPKILSVGRFSKEKNTISLIQACALARDKSTPFKLTIVGFGPEEANLKNEIKRLNMEKLIHMTGQVEHGKPLMDIFDSHDLICLPSLTEGVPRVVIEAFARRIGVVATRVGSLPTLFPDSIEFIDSPTPEGIQQSITVSLNDPSLLAKKIERGYASIDKFLIETNAKLVHETIQEFIG